MLTTRSWFLAIDKEMLPHIRQVAVVVEKEFPFQNPLEWLKFDDEVIPKDAHVRLCLSDTVESGLWRNTYELGKRCREAGMSWEDIAANIYNARELIMLSGTRVRGRR